MWTELLRIPVKAQDGSDAEVVYEGFRVNIPTSEGTITACTSWRFRLDDGRDVLRVQPGQYRTQGPMPEDFTGDPANDPPPPPWPNS